jgi:transmembrane sensor
MRDWGSVTDSTLDRYLAGEASVSERIQVDAWLAVHPGRSKAIELLRGDLTGAWDTNESWRRLNERIVEHTMGAGRDRRAPTWLRSPAFVLIALVIVVGAALFAVNRSSSSTVERPREWKTTAEAPRNRNRVELGDGSTAFLGPSTSLRYSVADRDAELNGAALFTTVHSDSRPFVVRARNVTTRDTGTQFVVRGYAKGDAVTVGVITGQVEVSAPGMRDAITLSQGEMVRVSPQGNTRMDHGVDPAVFAGWVGLPASALR